MIGRQFGPYRVESLLGVGGMGEVYRATDTVLGRQVAIKILPPDVAADPSWVARFRREAQVLAALNHPNVGAIYGFEMLDGHTGSAFGLVLELVEGPTLAETLKAGPLPVEEALAVAQQIAEALDAAHQQGIVHRDLKPGNITVREDGTVKVLDFGLAKVAGPPENAHERAAATGRRDPSLSPTITTPAMTAAGIILGTAAYMSPEQAKGNPVTKTTDIWAFGCVLYEMLTGKIAFKGDGSTDTLALVVRGEPDSSLLPSTIPPGIRTLLRHCLHKEPRRRWQDAASLRIAIEDARAAPVAAATAAATRTVNWRWALAAALAIVVAATLSALAVWSLSQPAPAPVARVLVGVSPASQIARTLQLPNARPFRSAIALSPDGQSLVFVGAVPVASGAVSRPPAAGLPESGIPARQLYVRAMGRLNAMPIEGTERADSPFFSPDGQWVGFWQADAAGLAQPGELKKVPLAGGPVVTLGRTPLPAGISWGPHGRIIFANHGGGGLWQVTDAGGTPEVLTTPNPASGELSHRLPHVLPDGRAVLFTIHKSPGGWDDTHVAVRSLVTGEQKPLVNGAADARYVASGHLVYARMGTLLPST